MTHQSERDLFVAALPLDAEARASYLQEACADPLRRARVLQLLAAHDQAATGFLQQSAIDIVMSEAGAPGRRIGAYELTREIGRGGMGVVYEAVRADDEYRKTVAVKVVNTPFASDDLVRRFRRERQILAELDHPYIARLLDGGTTDDGLPFLVMERVSGEPIDAFCRTHALSVRDRLLLFTKVCEAVQFAHSRLVVHRDLKPQNILVSDDGTPRLLDFGIAALISEEGIADQTRTGALRLTPQYASPEQVRGERVTTGSDVYSLGMVLYELLAGTKPYDLSKQSTADAVATVTGQVPARPSAVARAAGHAATGRQLDGDLDTIVLTALHKEPARRYPSVAALAADIGNHLEGRPVAARGDSLWYRTTRLVRRHRLGVTAAAAVAVSLLGGVAATVRQARIAVAERREADEQRARAERRFADVRRLANSFLFEFHDAIATLPGSTEARQLVVTKALEYLDGLAAESSDDRTLQRELAAAYDRVGDVQGNQSSANLGDASGALASYQKAQAIRRALAAGEPESLEIRLELALSGMKIGDAAFARGAVQDAVAAYRDALAPRQEALAAGVPSADTARARMVEVTGRLCTVLLAVGDVNGAIDNCRQNRTLTGELLAQRPDDQAIRAMRATNGTALGNALRVTRQHAEARTILEEAARLHGELLAANPNNTDVRRRLAVTYGYLANVHTDQNDTEGAAASLARAVQELDTLAAADRSNFRVRTELAYMLNRRAPLLIALGRATEARRDASRALAILGEATRRPGAGGEAFNEYAWALVSVEPADLRRPADALEAASEALRRAGGPNPVYQHTLAWAHYRLGRVSEAITALEAALARLTDAAGPTVGLRRQIEADLATFRKGLSQP
jgi:eukaryotic-like serine/threonine-protein kinase